MTGLGRRGVPLVAILLVPAGAFAQAAAEHAFLPYQYFLVFVVR